MMVALRVVEPFPEVREPGMMWRYSEGDADGRESWWVVLPNTHSDLGTPGHPSHPSQLSWRTTDRASDPPHEMWTVTGTAPNITVTPSIDVLRTVKQDDQWVRDGSYWHGFITNGEMA